MQKTLIESYRNVPGEHCGSTAMRNLIRHYCGLELSEAMVFGLGSGIDFVLLELDQFEPGVFMFGRSATMEADVADALALRYTEQIEPDDGRAWAVVRDEVVAGRPTMLSGDALYLDYRDFRVHFPSHRFVLVGFDDVAQRALIADRIDVEPQPCSYRALSASRNPPDFVSTTNLWGKFHDGSVGRAIAEAVPVAVQKAARRMLGGDTAAAPFARMDARSSNGIEGLADLAERLPAYLDRPDARALARYAGACIESFGTGGGNFRLMYADFLETARTTVCPRIGADDVEAVRSAAGLWTALSQQLRGFAAGEIDDVSGPAVALVGEIRDREARVFERLASV